jgi:uncharacterized protein with PIN domain
MDSLFDECPYCKGELKKVTDEKLIQTLNNIMVKGLKDEKTKVKW